MRCLGILAILAALPVQADILVATRTIRPKEIIAPSDVVLRDQSGDGLNDPALAIGQEAKVAIYAGRVLRGADIGPPALVERNQIVALIYATSFLSIETEARALARGAVGDRVRVINLSSRSTVFGEVQNDGSIMVKGK